MGNIFQYLGYGLSGVAILASGVALWMISRLKKSHNQLFQGKGAVSLENIMMDLAQRSEKLDHDIEDLFNASNQVNRLSLKGISKVGVIRFNPFEGKGHKECFSIALLNGKDKGVVLSTLTTENGSRMFVKQVDKGKSDILLTKEEEAAIKLAK